VRSLAGLGLVIVLDACGQSGTTSGDALGRAVADPGIDAASDSGTGDFDVDTSCVSFCAPFLAVTLNLSCLAVVSVQTTGPCGAVACRSKTDGGPCPQRQVTVAPTQVGSCHVELTFDDGYQYGVDLTFASTTQEGPCPCTSIGAISSVPAVDNPSTTCADAGPGAPGDAGVDAWEGPGPDGGGEAASEGGGEG
jgi:hypothetical protein